METFLGTPLSSVFILIFVFIIFCIILRFVLTFALPSLDINILSTATLFYIDIFTLYKHQDIFNGFKKIRD